jgi:hypothetical protein
MTASHQGAFVTATRTVLENPMAPDATVAADAGTRAPRLVIAEERSLAGKPARETPGVSSPWPAVASPLPSTSDPHDMTVPLAGERPRVSCLEQAEILCSRSCAKR